MTGLLLTARTTRNPHGIFLTNLWIPTIEGFRLDAVAGIQNDWYANTEILHEKTARFDSSGQNRVSI